MVCTIREGVDTEGNGACGKEWIPGAMEHMRGCGVENFRFCSMSWCASRGHFIPLFSQRRVDVPSQSALP